MRKVLLNIKKNLFLYIISVVISAIFWNALIFSKVNPKEENKLIILASPSMSSYSMLYDNINDERLINILKLDIIKPTNSNKLNSYYGLYFEKEFDFVILEAEEASSFIEQNYNDFLEISSEYKNTYIYNDIILGAKVKNEYINNGKTYYCFIRKTSIHIDSNKNSVDNAAIIFFNMIVEKE